MNNRNNLNFYCWIKFEIMKSSNPKMTHIKLLVKILSVLVTCKGVIRDSQYSTLNMSVYLTNACFLLMGWREIITWRAEQDTFAFQLWPSTFPPEDCRWGWGNCFLRQLVFSYWAFGQLLSFVYGCWRATSPGRGATWGSDWTGSPWKQRNQVGLTCMWFWTLTNLLRCPRGWVLLLFKQKGKARLCQATGMCGYAMHMSLWVDTSPL